MRDPKSLFLIVLVLTLTTISFILISIWGYRYYFPDIKTPVTQSANKTSAIKAPATKDSLQTLYNAAIQQFDTRQDSLFDNTDSMAVNLEKKLLQYNTIRNEIAGILKNKTSSAEMVIAHKKIIEFQQTVAQLRNKTNEVADENRRLNILLKQLINEQPKIGDTKTAVMVNKTSTKKNVSSPLAVSNLILTAVAFENGKENETFLASQTDKLEGAFYVKSNEGQPNSLELQVVVLQPNGKTLQNSGWESGVFETTSGKKIYSVKIHFDNAKGENQRLFFSLTAPAFQQGNYTMQVYHNGIMIGRLVKNLS